MKKGLLTVLLASLVLVGCQNYDDQFDDLNAQISALKSQVDGLSSLSGQVSSLAGTISGLQAGVSAAQAAATAAGASADAATAAATAAGTAATASTADLSGLEASLASLATDVAAVQASLATAATASAVTALQAELDAIESDLDDLLASSNIYSTDVTVTNATTLNAALALGNKLNVLNASLTITGYSGMSYADVQTLVDRVNTTTGNIVYTAASSLGTEIVFNNLVSAADITMTQPGGYHFPKLANAGTINMVSTYETLVTRVNFPALTTATAVQTDGSGTGITVDFTYATSVNFAAMVTAPTNVISITTKKDAVLDLSSWKSTDASGNTANATLTLNGPASFTNGTAAGTFASTGLAGNTVGAVDGTLSFTNVATVAVHNFRGDIELETGVKNFTGNNIVTLGTTTNPLTDAVSLETLNVTMIRDNAPDLLAATVANNDDSDDNTAQDMLFTAAHAKLTSATITGKTGDIAFTSVPLLTTVDLTGADAFDVSASGNAALTSWTDASKAEDRIFNDNDLMTSVSLSATTKLTATSDKAVSVSVDGNAELTSVTLGMDDVEDLDITSNPKLATVSASAMKDNGTSDDTDVKIYGNALVASLVRDTKETAATIAATGWAVGGTTDSGSITTASGIKGLDPFLTDAIAADGTVSVWFDTVTKLEIQATYGGVYTDTTSSLTAPSTTPTSAEAADFDTNYTGYYAYVYNLDGVTAVSTTDGKIDNERDTWAWDLNRNATTLAQTGLTAGEGYDVVKDDVVLASFVQGASYTGAANGATVATVADLISYMNADTSLETGYNLDLVAAQDGFNKALYTVTFTNSTGANATAGASSGTGNLSITIGTGNDGKVETTAFAVTNGSTQANFTDELVNAFNNSGDYTAAETGGNTNAFYVTKHVSGSGLDRSPMVSLSDFPSITFNTTANTTTARLAATGYAAIVSGGVTFHSATASEANAAAEAASLYTLTSAKSLLSGVRVTLVNEGVGAMSAGTFVTPGSVSNGAIASASTSVSAAANNILTAGTNIVTYVAKSATVAGTETVANYVAAYSAISSGSSRVTTSGVTAVLTNRTGW
jgi:hypothetical protein